MTHTNIHRTFQASAFTSGEHRLICAWGSGAEKKSSASDAEKNLRKKTDRENYVKKELTTIDSDTDKADDRVQRRAFLRKLKPTDDGLIKLEQIIGLKFGRDEAGICQRN